mmetsp:Transcript_29053/g.52925  ORF Transcript_29053/g.52925 Transcript_29053/m.52925 type:complete len:276 (+) Transcript_29053:64-891(+)
MSSDHYAVLGVAPDASAKDIAKAFRAKARVLHPDKQPIGASEDAKQRAKQAFQALARAYEILGDENKRRTYDLSKQSGGVTTHGEGEEEDWTPPPNEWDDPNSAYYTGRTGPRPKRKARKTAQEEDAEEARQGDVNYADLGSHWIGGKQKGKSKAQQPAWAGWATAAMPPQKTKGGKKDEDDAKSDASSELSFDWRDFNIGTKLDDIDFSLLQPVHPEDANEELGLGGGEFLRIRPSQQEAAQAEKKVEEQEAAQKEQEKRKQDKAAQKRCCTLQ